MNKYLVAFLFTGVIAFSSSWIHDGNGIISSAYADTTDVNPNGSSELSLMMREMYTHTAAARKALDENKVAPYPESFLNIKTAKPTDEETKKEYYNTFADLYLQSLENYKNSDKKNLQRNYTALINTCLGCHSSHCPGPVPKIKKLQLPIDTK